MIRSNQNLVEFGIFYLFWMDLPSWFSLLQISVSVSDKINVEVCSKLLIKKVFFSEEEEEEKKKNEKRLKAAVAVEVLLQSQKLRLLGS